MCNKHHRWLQKFKPTVNASHEAVERYRLLGRSAEQEPEGLKKGLTPRWGEEGAGHSEEREPGFGTRFWLNSSLSAGLSYCLRPILFAQSPGTTNVDNVVRGLQQGLSHHLGVMPLSDYRFSLWSHMLLERAPS